MKKHVIAGHIGPTDRPRLPRVRGVTNTKIDLLSSNRRLDFGIDNAIHELCKIGIFPSEVGLDLLVLAALIQAADTRVSRTSESQDSWTREIKIVVPVSNVELWSSVTNLLQKTLDFLSGDRWDFEFRSRPVRFNEMIPKRESDSPFPQVNQLSLFSGGLDSLIGAIDILDSSSKPLLISHAAEGATSDAQNRCFEKLTAHFGEDAMERLRLWMSFPEGLVRNVSAEKTSRSRSFLFFSLGVFAGTGMNAPFSLRVPENGLISLNVPLDSVRLGALSTRTTHPYYMARWNDLLTKLGMQGEIINPYWDKTKGEMIQGCRNQPLLKAVISCSMSCASPTKGRWQGRPTEHCGHCLPCIIRRSAIEKAWGSNQDPTIYSLIDLKAHPLSSSRAEGQQVRSFQYAISRLQRRPGIERLLIHKPGSLADVGAQHNELAAVYRRGMDEVDAFLSGVTTRPD